MVQLIGHPFKDGVRQILNQHFHESIAKRFVLIFEATIFNKESINIWNQLKHDQPILEVRYNQDDVRTEYICDLYPWEKRDRTEAHLLRFITDAVKSGKIGKDWDLGEDGKMSRVIKSGELITKGI